MDDYESNSSDTENSDTEDVDRDEFYRKLYQVYKNKRGLNSVLLAREKYNYLVARIKAAKTTLKKTSSDYHRLKKFEVIRTPDGDKLFTLPTPGNKRRQMMVPMDEMYDIIKKYHIMLNHGGRTRMRDELKQKYKNITAESVLVYLSMCKSCKNKTIYKRGRPGEKPGFSPLHETPEEDFCVPADPISECSPTTVKSEVETEEVIRDIPAPIPISTYKYPELYSRGQVDILGVTTELGADYKYLMIYRNLTNKYIHLKPMKELNVEDAVEALLTIFLEYGAPNILQSKNGLDLIKPICTQIADLHEEIKVIPSEKLFNKSDFKGKSNEDILKKLNDWLITSLNTKWYQGLKYVQHDFNTVFHEALCRTPCQMVFGSDPRRGIASVFPKNICDDISTEQDLIAVLENKGSVATIEVKEEESVTLPSDSIKEEADSDDENVVEDKELIA